MSGTKLIKRNRGTATKSKNIGSPIVIQSFRLHDTDGNYPLIEKFLTSNSAEDQLGTLKNILDEFIEGNDEKVTLFLAVLFYEAPAKHPIKCFLTRHITKCATIYSTFTRSLTSYIDAEIRNHENKQDLIFYKRNVPQIMMCTENFSPGAKAVENLDVKFLIQRLIVDYFTNARNNYRGNTTPSPTEKNEQFSLEHVMLRLLVYVLQNISVTESNQQEYHHCFENITECAKTLIFDEDVPMDTKSLAGILVLHVESIVSSWQDACSFVLSGNGTFSATRALLSASTGRLVMLCGVAAAAPLSALTPCAREEHPMLVLVDQLLPFADGAAGSGDVTVCVARALVALASRALAEPATPTEPAAPAELVPHLLPFVWAHLEHPLDAVRHLARALLAHCLQYAAREEKLGGPKNSEEESPLESLLSSVRALGPCRSLYWTVPAACGVLGARRVLEHLAPPGQLVWAATQPHLHAAAAAAITAVLAGGACADLAPNVVFDTWVSGALASPPALQAVLPPATQACPQLPDYINSVVRGRELLECARACGACRAPLAPRTLRAHAIHQDDESRMLVVSLLCERERATEVAPREDLATLLWVLHYNLASPRPAFRTALLHYVSKLLKRLEDSSRAAHKRGRGDECAHYRPFIQRVKLLAVCGAGQGSAPARRATALQLLASLAPHIQGDWGAEDVVTLIQALDDSYDGNKELALRALAHCPMELLERCCPFTLSDIVSETRGPRAAHGAAAAAKLCMLLNLLPHTLPTPESVEDVNTMGIEERAYYSAAVTLHTALVSCGAGTLRAHAARGGAHGTLRCVRALLHHALHRRATWRSVTWCTLHERLLEACVRACTCAEPAVCSQAPEGFLPPCTSGELEGEEAQVTAQMVLVCAWRTIKEGAAVISLLGPLVPPQVCLEAGNYLVGLLTRARHRGAVDQAAEGLLALAQQCWVDTERAAFPRCWLDTLLALVSGGAPHATRRGAGLTAAIQALVSSEVTATGRADCFENCMEKLLQIATTRNDSPDTQYDSPDTRNDTSDTNNGVPDTESTENDAPDTEDGDNSSNLPQDVTRRTLAANILRALFRHSALDRASQPFVSDGLKLALNGFEAAAWPERTAMSLLFCALCVRVFGVVRTRGALHARNTLPAHVLCARYPGIYTLMLSKLRGCDAVGTGPGVLPVLLVLQRVYTTPATHASLQMWRFVPLVQQCACASDLRVRRLAARALPPLLTPHQQLPYIEKLLAAVSNPNLQRNHWHGALLTLSSLIERAPCSDPIGLTLNANDTLNGGYDTLKGGYDTLEWYSTRDEINTQENPSNIHYGSPKSLEGSSNGNLTNQTKPFDETDKKSNDRNNGNKSNDETDTGARSNDVETSNKPERSNPQRSTVTLRGYTPVGSLVSNTLCALIQATGDRPCYVIAREYCNVFNLLVWKYPSMVGADTAVKAMGYLDTMLFHGTTDFGADKELCLADCLLLYLVLLQRRGREMPNPLCFVHRMGRVSEISSLIIRALSHKTYEVCLAACDFLLIQQDKFEDDPCLILQHLITIRNISLIQTLRTSEHYQTYLNILTNITNDTKQYQECRSKSLRLLTLENDTQLLILSEKMTTEQQNDENKRLWVVTKLIQNIQEDNLTKHMYLESLLQYIKGKMVHLNYSQAINVLEVLYDCSSSQNTVECRLALVTYLESDLDEIIGITWENQPPEIMFQYKALIYSTLVTLLEDDDDDTRQRASDVIAGVTCPVSPHGCDVTTHEDASLADPYDVTWSLALLRQAVRDNSSRDVTPAASGALLRAHLQTEQDGCALLLLLALLDFRAEVCFTDARDESRVFDQSERYNVLLEESVWTHTCTDALIQMNTDKPDLLNYSLTIIHDKKYAHTFQSLCQDNLKIFEKMTKGESVAKDETLNPKIEVLVNKLRR